MNKNINKFLMATGKGAISLIPGGAFLSEYLTLAQEHVGEKRMERWIEKVDNVIKDLSEKIDDLAQNEAFYSCVQVATIGALKTFEIEKMEYYANALYSSARNMNISNEKKLFYLTLLDRYTLSHILILKYFSENHFDNKPNPTNGIKITHVGGTEKPIVGIIENIPYLDKDSLFVKHITNQLYSDSLIYNVDLDMPVSPKQARAKRTTKYGDEFLAFIHNYKKEHNEE